MQIPSTYKATVSGLKANVRLAGDASDVTLTYSLTTKLGRRLECNVGCAREVLANYIRQELGLPRGDNATRFTFVGV